MDYIELSVEFEQTDPWRDILVSILNDHGFESFVETKTGLQAYINEQIFSADVIDEVKKMNSVISVAHKKIISENWNAKWEENFDPVLVEDKVAIIAPFHSGDFDVQLTVTIQPQMSFGTGHHETTWLMSKRIFELELNQKSVLDMGTGTGVLAIIAEKRGASSVFAPDIDDWSYRNALENCDLNECKRIEVAHGGHELLANQTFDLIAANINKNVLIEHFSVYSKCLKPSGKLLISGFFETDQADLISSAEEHGFIFELTNTKGDWAMIEFNAPSLD